MLYQLSYFRNSEYKVTPLFRIRKSCARKNAGYPTIFFSDARLRGFFRGFPSGE